ncbi:MAG: MtrB/PioB family decaheme-associated outer membrane protein [Betaproteobacteria bacterium]|nr:MtrB/PioB family decaheme-associated outer membrane protein [Betaproteobacteria bacterium]
MKNMNPHFKLSVLALAVAAALTALPAQADDQEAAALKTPSNFLELGPIYNSADSAKYGEYTGLDRSGWYLGGNMGIRGGNAYNNNEGGGTERWSIFGDDLGLTSRTLKGTYSNQGSWSVGVGYDELRHYITDTYQTPYMGAMGNNVFTLPSSFGTASNTTTLNSAQLGAFHPLEISSTRANTSFNSNLIINSRLNLSFDYNHLDQSGAKLMGFGAAALNGASGEVVSILPMPTSYQTDTINLALNWKGDKGHMTGGYYGSLFRNNYNQVTFQTFGGANTLQNMSTAPSNMFHQLNLAGGYNFSERTKFAGNLSYGRNTQDSGFVVDPGMMVSPMPRTSLDGLVNTTHADMKLTDQTTRKLKLSAGLKYDERDNQTSSNIYNFNAISGETASIANYPNTPLSTRKYQVELAGDYALAKKQNLRLAYTYEDTSRWCNQYGVNAGYPAGTNCVVATSTKDNRMDATYKLQPYESLNVRLGYVYSDRNSNFDPNAIAAFIGTKGNPVTATTLIPGLNAGDFPGFYPMFDASRTQQGPKANLNWQATDRLSLGMGGKYTEDNYYDSTYGVKSGKSWSLNLDANYQYRESGSLSAYFTRQARERTMTNLQNGPTTVTTATATRISVPANGSWNNTLTDDDTTFGLGIKQGGFMQGKLELTGDLTYSLGNTNYGTQLNYATTTTTGLTCGAASIMSCGSLPDIRNAMTQLKLGSTYQVDKNSKVALRYIYQHLSSNDYYYNGYQYLYTPTTLMATNQQPGGYSVNTVAVTYVYNF